MTDKSLYEHIRKLVKQQKVQQILDVKHENFAEEYCKHELLKKKQQKYQENRMNTLLKNFKNVESYINIMDIIQDLQLNMNKGDKVTQAEGIKEQLPEIIPKSLQLKIKEEIAPILNKRYEEESIKREELLTSLKENITSSNNDFLQENVLLQDLLIALENNKLTEKLELIDVLRNDIKLKEIYFIEKRFDKEMDDINKIPKKLENTKLFHKICSYLHMILEQQHKEKWASKKQQKFKEEHCKFNVRKKMRIPTVIRNYSNSLMKRNTSKFKEHSRFQSTFYKDMSLSKDSFDMTDLYRSNEATPRKKAKFDDEIDSQIDELSDEADNFKDSAKRVQSKQELVKQSFTFRKRGIKAGLMSKINRFVDNINDEEKKNVQVSKKYCKALQSLSQELETSYGRFKREELAQEEDIEDMKKYLDNTLSRNKKDLKKFHHK